MRRRKLMGAFMALGSGGVLGLSACASGNLQPARAQVVVIGGGYGGATAAKYVRLLSDHRIDVVLIEPDSQFVSCPVSNQILGGSKTIADVTVSYDTLRRKYGIVHVQTRARDVDVVKKVVTLADGSTLGYDRLVVSPGVDMLWDSVEGLAAASAQGTILQAWKAGPQTLALRRQLEEMPDGGVYAITVPPIPYRCPSAPYERASQVAHYFRQAKPRSKVLIFDANPDITSKPALFKRFWASHYAGLLEYRPNCKAEGVDVKTGSIRFEAADDERADVLNVLPDMGAADIAMRAGLVNINHRWCAVDYLTFESTAAPDVHVIGDSVLSAALMPKSGHIANAQAKVAAAAIVARLSGWDVNPEPMLTNTCYSMLDDKQAIHVAAVYHYLASEKTFEIVRGSSGISARASELEGIYAANWAQNIWADALL